MQLICKQRGPMAMCTQVCVEVAMVCEELKVSRVVSAGPGCAGAGQQIRVPAADGAVLGCAQGLGPDGVR